MSYKNEGQTPFWIVDIEKMKMEKHDRNWIIRKNKQYYKLGFSRKHRVCSVCGRHCCQRKGECNKK